MSALNKQVGGSHYKVGAIQPIEYIEENNLGYHEGNVVKYITRWRDKNGIQDLEKAIHYIELLIEKQIRDEQQQQPTTERTCDTECDCHSYCNDDTDCVYEHCVCTGR